MFLGSLIEELCTKKENNKVGCTLTFGGQCIYISIIPNILFHQTVVDRDCLNNPVD